MLTFFTVLIVFSILILVHEAGHLFAAKRIGVKVEVFSLGFGKRLFGVKRGDTDYRISLIPFGGYVKMAGEDPSEGEGHDYELSSKPVGKRFWVMTSGALTNYIFAFILFWAIFMIGAPTLSNGVGQVLKGYPAEKAGIKVGDQILTIAGEKIEHWEDIVGAIKKNATGDNVLNFEILREGKVESVDIRPDISTVTNIFGQEISRPVIGIGPQNEILSVSYNPIQAFYEGGKHLITLTAMTYKGIWLLITGGMPVKTSVSGPLGIMRIMGQAAQLGIVPLLIITAQVSMALAIFNLLPFPVLDGGHVLFLALEKVRKRPLSARVQEVISYIAIALLLSLMLFVTWHDIAKTSIGEKWRNAEKQK